MKEFFIGNEALNALVFTFICCYRCSFRLTAWLCEDFADLKRQFFQEEYKNPPTNYFKPLQMRKFSQISRHFDQYKWERRTIRLERLQEFHTAPPPDDPHQSWAPWLDCAAVTSCNMPVFTCYVNCYGKLKYCWACCWYADNPQCQTACVLPQARRSGLCTSHMALTPDMFSMIFLQLPNSIFVPLKQQLYQDTWRTRSKITCKPWCVE